MSILKLVLALVLLLGTGVAQDVASVTIKLRPGSPVEVAIEASGLWMPAATLPEHGSGEWRPHEAERLVSRATWSVDGGPAEPIEIVDGRLQPSAPPAETARVRLNLEATIPPRSARSVHWGDEAARTWLLDLARIVPAPAGAVAEPRIHLRFDVEDGDRIHCPLPPLAGTPEGQGFVAHSFAHLYTARTVIGKVERLDVDGLAAPLRLVYVPRTPDDDPVLPAIEDAARKLFLEAERGLFTHPKAIRQIICFAGGRRFVQSNDVALVPSPRTSDAAALDDLLLSLSEAHLGGYFWSGRRALSDPWRDLEAPRDLWLRMGGPRYLAVVMAMRSGVLPRPRALARLTEILEEWLSHREAAHVSVIAAADRLVETGQRNRALLDPRVAGTALAMLLDFQLRTAPNDASALEKLLPTSAEMRFSGGPKFADRAGDLLGAWVGSSEDHARFFDTHIAGIERAPVASLLEAMGFLCEVLPTRIRDPGIPLVPDTRGLLIGVMNRVMSAEAPGIEEGDRVLRIKGRQVRTMADYRRILATAKPGERLRVDVQRGSRQRSVRLLLRPPRPFEIPLEQGGLEVSAVPFGPLATSGLQVGDRIERVGRRRITGEDDIRDELGRSRGSRGIVLGVVRDGRRKKVAVKPDGRGPVRVLIEPDPDARDERLARRKAWEQGTK